MLWRWPRRMAGGGDGFRSGAAPNRKVAGVTNPFSPPPPRDQIKNLPFLGNEHSKQGEGNLTAEKKEHTPMYWSDFDTS